MHRVPGRTDALLLCIEGDTRGTTRKPVASCAKEKGQTCFYKNRSGPFSTCGLTPRRVQRLVEIEYQAKSGFPQTTGLAEIVEIAIVEFLIYVAARTVD